MLPFDKAYIKRKKISNNQPSFTSQKLEKENKVNPNLAEEGNKNIRAEINRE